MYNWTTIQCRIDFDLSLFSQAGHMLISLPETCLLTTSTVLNSYLGPFIKRYAPKNNLKYCDILFLECNSLQLLISVCFKVFKFNHLINFVYSLYICIITELTQRMWIWFLDYITYKHTGTIGVETSALFPPPSWKFPLSPLLALCVFLVCERHRGKASDWFPYIDVLPNSYTCPAYFTDEVMAVLPPGVQRNAQEQREAVREFYSSNKDFFRCVSHRTEAITGVSEGVKIRITHRTSLWEKSLLYSMFLVLKKVLLIINIIMHRF